MEERRPDCSQEFNRIWERLNKGDNRFSMSDEVHHSQDIRITKLEVNMLSLIQSLGGLIKAIWGVVIAVATTGIGFVIWYIQNHG